MAKNSLESVLQHLRRVALTGSDAHLLERFARQGDEAAFERLVLLHGPLVLGLCRRLLRHEQDAEDAFQATFLTLARKARTISKREALASWLYKVAYRIACRVRGGLLTNRMAVFARLAARTSGVGGDLRGALDHEIARLAEHYRRPLVLCYLEGNTIEETARLLGCPSGTVASRLARAKEQLRRRLTRRGWALSTGALATLLTDKAIAAPLPAGLVKSTLAYVAGTAAKAGTLATRVFALSDGVLRMLWLNKMKMAAGLLVAVALAGTGVGLLVRQTWAGATGQLPAQVQKAGPNKDNREKNPEIVELRNEMARLRGELDTALKELKKRAAPPDDNAEIKKLLKQRHDELAMRVDYWTARVREGRATVEPLLEAQHEALEAKLDLDEDPNQRVTALRKFLEAVTQTHDAIDEKLKLGGIAAADPGTLHKSKALVLETQIALLRAELRAGSKKPAK
jgi:DNA-directed RNA polymerase specialized sigma24 family protein